MFGMDPESRPWSNSCSCMVSLGRHYCVIYGLVYVVHDPGKV